MRRTLAKMGIGSLGVTAVAGGLAAFCPSYLGIKRVDNGAYTVTEWLGTTALLAATLAFYCLYHAMTLNEAETGKA